MRTVRVRRITDATLEGTTIQAAEKERKQLADIPYGEVVLARVRGGTRRCVVRYSRLVVLDKPLRKRTTTNRAERWADQQVIRICKAENPLRALMSEISMYRNIRYVERIIEGVGKHVKWTRNCEQCQHRFSCATE